MMTDAFASSAGASRHCLDQTTAATALLDSTSAGTAAALGSPSTTRDWIKTRCVEHNDSIKATATGFNREPVSSAVSSLAMGQGCFEAEFQIAVLKGCLSLGVVRLAGDNRERKGMAAPIAGDARDDGKWGASPCAKWTSKDKISQAFYITEKGELKNGSSRVLPPGWRTLDDNGIRWGSLVSVTADSVAGGVGGEDRHSDGMVARSR